ncbi:MAG: VCBS repeat-containing protein [Phycisphaeraceae bacterium]|nr:VCBS repeat-containing protein [Phycisphaeraceae bacterium]
MRSGRRAAVAGLAAGAALAAGSAGQVPPLSEYFGFDPPRIIVVDDGCGPSAVFDMNADRRPDVVVVNNRKSRLEIHSLRAKERTLEEAERTFEVNEIAPSPWYDRVDVVVRDRIGALAPIDVDSDGLGDLVYVSGAPEGVVMLRQVEPGQFREVSRRPLSGIAAKSEALAIGDVMGDGRPEILAIVGGAAHAMTLSSDGSIGLARRIGVPADLRSVFAADLNGDGRLDVLASSGAVVSPLRAWLQEPGPDGVPMLARELRFDVPSLQDAGPVRLPGSRATCIATLETATRRLVLSRLGTGDLDEREATVLAELISFPDDAQRERSCVTADLNRDGLPDLVTTDQKGNAVAVHWQRPGVGLTPAQTFAAFKRPASVAVGRWSRGSEPAVFVLSEEEKAVGVAWFDDATGTLSFPEPLSLATGGAAPVTMRCLELDDRPTLAVVVKQRRDLALELHSIDPATGEAMETTIVELKDLIRPPAAIRVIDADRDGLTDLLLLTPGEPMVMVHGEATAEGSRPSRIINKDAMKQFGLVQAAGPVNTLLMDVNGDGADELLIADENFVRAVEYHAERGWRVVEQYNLPDPQTRLVGMASLGGIEGALVVSDGASGRLLVLDRTNSGWSLGRSLRLVGFAPGAIEAGAFLGSTETGVLALGEAGFAAVRLRGHAITLDELAVYRPDAEDRLEHELASGDLNGDGYTDLVTLDARSQMCAVLTVSKSERVLPATEFKVFESRLFERGDAREFEPSAAMIVDCTGDDRDDLLLVVHDRLIVYPQATGR